MEERLVPTGEKIKQFLQEKGLKQKILVEKGNYSKKQVSKVLSSPASSFSPLCPLPFILGARDVGNGMA